jgi:hypothetical protein
MQVAILGMHCAHYITPYACMAVRPGAYRPRHSGGLPREIWHTRAALSPSSREACASRAARKSIANQTRTSTRARAHAHMTCTGALARARAHAHMTCTGAGASTCARTHADPCRSRHVHAHMHIHAHMQTHLHTLARTLVRTDTGAGASTCARTRANPAGSCCRTYGMPAISVDLGSYLWH